MPGLNAFVSHSTYTPSQQGSLKNSDSIVSSVAKHQPGRHGDQRGIQPSAHSRDRHAVNKLAPEVSTKTAKNIYMHVLQPAIESLRTPNLAQPELKTAYLQLQQTFALSKELQTEDVNSLVNAVTDAFSSVTVEESVSHLINYVNTLSSAEPTLPLKEIVSSLSEQNSTFSETLVSKLSRSPGLRASNFLDFV